MTYEFGPCSCGHSITVEADSDDAAVQQAVGQVPAHFAEFHPGEPVISAAEAEPMLRQLMHEAA